MCVCVCREPQEQKKPEEKAEVAEKMEVRKAESKRAAKGAGKEPEVSGVSNQKKKAKLMT